MAEHALPSPTDPVPTALSVYAYIGASSNRSDELHAQGTLRLRDDLRTDAGLLVAPLGVMVLDCAASNTQFLALSAPVRVDVHLLDPGHGVERLAIDGRITRNGRTLITTEARLADADDPGRLVGYATTTFAATGPPRSAAQYTHTAPPEGMATTGWPPLALAYGGQRTPEGGWQLAALDPAAGRRRLHSGNMMAVAEAACHELVGERAGGGGWLTTLLSTTVMTEGRVGPFAVVPELLALAGGTATCKVEVRDTGADDRFVALHTLRLVRPPVA
jgi:acyl-coenzyme A thioesterase PaaI-like protein